MLEATRVRLLVQGIWSNDHHDESKVTSLNTNCCVSSSSQSGFLTLKKDLQSLLVLKFSVTLVSFASSAFLSSGRNVCRNSCLTSLFAQSRSARYCACMAMWEEKCSAKLYNDLKAGFTNLVWKSCSQINFYMSEVFKNTLCSSPPWAFLWIARDFFVLTPCTSKSEQWRYGKWIPFC